MVILTGILDYGHAYFVDLTMTNAAREGARVGATRRADQASAAAIAAAEAYLAAAGVSATVTASTPSDAEPAVEVVVTLSPFEPLVGLVPAPEQLQTSATMRWELAKVEP
jgi:hypothetical protein